MSIITNRPLVYLFLGLFAYFLCVFTGDGFDWGFLRHVNRRAAQVQYTASQSFTMGLNRMEPGNSAPDYSEFINSLHSLLFFLWDFADFF